MEAVPGRWYEIAEDGTETNVRRIIVWEPPRRFAMTSDTLPSAAASEES